MEARRTCWAFVLAATLSMGARYATPNFVVTAPSPEMAKTIAETAERYREELAQLWLGRTLPQWAQPCPIRADVAPEKGSGGVTTFVFNAGHVYDWRMAIQGSYERILDSVLPHEINHTIFASHFRQPLPRWADEGACTTVEHPSERGKQQQMLIHFLRNRRGISFSEMFRMKEYPSDMLPLYAQGHSLATYLISQGGHHKFLQYLAEGMKDENWAAATARHYGFQGLGDLQNRWLDWVKQGSPALDENTLIAANETKRERPQPNLLVRGQSPERGISSNRPVAPISTDTYAERRDGDYPPNVMVDNGQRRPSEQGWHAPNEMLAGSAFRDHSAPVTQPAAQSMQVTRPQSPEKARQIIVEWSRDEALPSSRAGSPQVPAADPPGQGQPLRPPIYMSGEPLRR